MQQYAENAVQEHMKKLQQSYYIHLGKQEPWDKNPAILKNAIQNSTVYQRLKHQGLAEKDILKILNEKKAMLVYSPEEGEMRVDYSSIDSIKHYLKILHPAMIAVEPQSGKVKAWVGDLNYKYFQYDQVEAPRQVGSVFKPVVYSAAIHQGTRLDAYYKNEQKTYPEYDDWSPRNSDNNYEGYYTLKGALSQYHRCRSIASDGHRHRYRSCPPFGYHLRASSLSFFSLGSSRYPLAGNGSSFYDFCQ